MNFQVADLLSQHIKGSYSGNVTQGSLYNYQYARRRLLATSTVTASNFSGILNPVVCLEYGELMMFSVTNVYYPVYDR
jgi:hypothetical protein